MASFNIDLPPCTHRYLPLSSCRGASYSRNEGLYLIVVYLFAVLNNAAASNLPRPYISLKNRDCYRQDLCGTSPEEKSAA